MADSQSKRSSPCDLSYDKVREDLDQWHTTIVSKLDQISDEILLDMNTTFDDVHYFASFTNGLLIEQENQLNKATSNEEMDMIEERIRQIVLEIELLQSLSFDLNCQSIQLSGKLPIKLNNHDITANDPLMSIASYLHTPPRTISDLPTNHNYRFLISRTDAIELEKLLLPDLHFTSIENASLHECILTFDLSDLDSFLHAFTSYWAFCPNHNQIRLLISSLNSSLITGQSGETVRHLSNRFQLNEIRIYPDFCPKSTEKILFIHGKQRELMRDCLEEIYYNIEENKKTHCTNESIQFYNPASLSIDEIDEIMNSNLDYGGLIPNQRLSVERTNGIEDEDDDDLWNENDQWWNGQYPSENSSDIIQREMSVSNLQAGVIIGLNASRIDRIKQKTGAYIYINGKTKDLKRTVFIKGTRAQANRAYTWIENLLERHQNGKLPMPQRFSPEEK